MVCDWIMGMRKRFYFENKGERWNRKIKEMNEMKN